MKLRNAVGPLLSSDGLVALLVLTEDGLPVEMFGYGVRAEDLAAEIAGVARSARRACRALGLGEPRSQRISLGTHLIDIYPVHEHYLALVVDRERFAEPASHLLESTLAPLESALRGEA